MSRKRINISVADVSSGADRKREVAAYLSRPFGRWGVHRSINPAEDGCWALTLIGVGYRLPELLYLKRLDLLELADILDGSVDTSGVTGPTIDDGWTIEVRTQVSNIVRPFADAKTGGISLGEILASAHPERAA